MLLYLLWLCLQKYLLVSFGLLLVLESSFNKSQLMRFLQVFEIIFSWPKMGYYIRIKPKLATIVRLLAKVFTDLSDFILVYSFFVVSMAVVYMVIDTTAPADDYPHIPDVVKLLMYALRESVGEGFCFVGGVFCCA